MKLTSMDARVRGVVAELIVELDGIHFEAIRIGIGSDAAEVAQRLHALAARIAHRAAGVGGTRTDLSKPCPSCPAQAWHVCGHYASGVNGTGHQTFGEQPPTD